MVEPEDIEQTGFDPEQIFNEGRSLGQEESEELLREQLFEGLVANGMDPDEVEQALYDPAPRKHRRGHKRGKVHCSAKQMAKMPQICKGSRSKGRPYDPAPRKHHHYDKIPSHWRRTYDPAPVRQAARRYGKRAKGAIAGLKPFVLPGVTIGTFLMEYSKRASALKAAGTVNPKNGKPVTDIWSAIMYDIQNRPTTTFWSRFKDDAGVIVGSAVAGLALPYVAEMIPKGTKGKGTIKTVADVGGKALIGYGLGELIKDIFDPPTSNNPGVTQQTAPMRIVTQQVSQSAGMVAVPPMV